MMNPVRFGRAQVVITENSKKHHGPLYHFQMQQALKGMDKAIEAIPDGTKIVFDNPEGTIGNFEAGVAAMMGLPHKGGEKYYNRDTATIYRKEPLENRPNSERQIGYVHREIPEDKVMTQSSMLNEWFVYSQSVKNYVQKTIQEAIRLTAPKSTEQ